MARQCHSISVCVYLDSSLERENDYYYCCYCCANIRPNVYWNVHVTVCVDVQTIQRSRRQSSPLSFGWPPDDNG